MIRPRVGLRRIVVLVTLLLLPTLVAPWAVRGQTPKPADQVTLRLGWSYGGPFAPIYLGVEKGFFAEKGIQLNILEGKGTVPSASTVANGSDNFGYFDMGAAARLIDKGVPLRGIAQIRQKTTMGLVSLAKSGIKEPKDLLGRTVSNTPGDSISQVFPAFVKATGLDRSKIRQEGLDYSIYLKALADGKVDAVMGYRDWEGFTLENQGLQINFIPFAAHGVNIVDYGFVTNLDMLQKNPDLVRRFVTAVVQSFTYATTHVDEALQVGERRFPEFDAKLARKQLEFQPTLYGDSVSQGKPIGWIDRALWEKTLAVLKEYMGLKDTDPSRYYTNEFIPGA
jgi:NitT/TauT family transport system substrate-binding protein